MEKENLMKQEIGKEIREIMGEMQCSKNFKCSSYGLKKLCKAKDIGKKKHLVCLESDPTDCEFSIDSVSEYFCSCPLRIFIARKLGK